jgi:membrane fusion protein (multidrug efflux system)
LVLGLVGGLAAVKANQIGTLIAAGEAAKKAGPPPETVASTPAKKEHWESKLESIGSVEAGKGVAISNDSPGIVTRLFFESGDRVKARTVLAELDTSVERAQLRSAEARLTLAETTLNRTLALVQQGVSTGAELDTAHATLNTTTAEASALRAQIARKLVRAPFAGELGIRTVNVGQYLSPGTVIAELQSEKEQFVDFSLPQQYLKKLRVGLKVKLDVDGAGIDLDGVVAAVSPAVDDATRAVKLRASASDPEKRLRPGMFVTVTVMLDERRELVVVPVTAVVYAPYGDSVFVIEDAKQGGGKLAQQQFVKLGKARGDFVEVTKGLKGNELLVSAGAFKLRNGTAITVNNKAQPQPKQRPTPPNR